MTQASQPVDFDSRPPMPVSEYEQTVRRVNVGYDFLFTLTACFLRALRKPGLNLLVVGAGGGTELEHFLPDNPGWHVTGVDPSQDMLREAEARVSRLGVQDRVSLVRGRVQDLEPGAIFDAATCLFVLHFLPDHEKLDLLRAISARLQPGAPLLAAAPTSPDPDALRDDWLGAWQQYGELMGMPADQMAATIARLADMPAANEESYVRLLHEAGFQRVSCFFSALVEKGWIAR